MVRLIARFLDADDRVLAWVEFSGHMKGDGAIWHDGPIVAVGEAEGVAVTFHLHWPDLHFQRRVALAPTLVHVAQPIAVPCAGEIVRFDHPADHPPLPAVTVRAPIQVAPFSGALGATAGRP